MDQSRQKIKEIIQNHNIYLDKASAPSLKSTIQHKLDLSSKLRIIPDITNIEERRRKDKVLKHFKSMRHEVSLNSFQQQLRDSHEQVIGLEKTWNSQKEHSNQLTNPFKDLRKKMHGTQADFSKMQHHLREFGPPDCRIAQTVHHNEQEDYNSPLSVDYEDIIINNEEITAFQQDLEYQQSEVVKEEDDNLSTLCITPIKSKRAMTSRCSSNPKADNRSYIDYLRAKYVPDVSSFLSTKDTRLISQKAFDSIYEINRSYGVLKSVDKNHHKRNDRSRYSIDNSKNQIICRNQKELQEPIFTQSANKKTLANTSFKQRSVSAGRTRSSLMNSPNPQQKSNHFEHLEFSPKGPKINIDNLLFTTRQNLRSKIKVNRSNNNQKYPRCNSSITDNKYPHDFNKILEKFTTDGTRL